MSSPGPMWSAFVRWAVRRPPKRRRNAATTAAIRLTRALPSHEPKDLPTKGSRQSCRGRWTARGHAIPPRECRAWPEACRAAARINTVLGVAGGGLPRRVRVGPRGPAVPPRGLRRLDAAREPRGSPGADHRPEDTAGANLRRVKRVDRISARRRKQTIQGENATLRIGGVPRTAAQAFKSMVMRDPDIHHPWATGGSAARISFCTATSTLAAE